MLVSICMKFHDDTGNGFKVTERTQFCDGQTDRQVQRGITKKYKYKSYGSCALHVVFCWLIFV